MVFTVLKCSTPTVLGLLLSVCFNWNALVMNFVLLNLAYRNLGGASAVNSTSSQLNNNNTLMQLLDCKIPGILYVKVSIIRSCGFITSL